MRTLAILTGLALLPAVRAAAQQAGAVVRVHVTHDGVAVAGAIARIGSAGRVTDDVGRAMLHVEPGALTLVVTRIGFRPDTSALRVAAGGDTTIQVALSAVAFQAEAVVVAATRTDRRVEDTPIRVEVVDEDEILEKGAMTPGDITMMLNETPGLRVQTTSPSLGGAGVRVQGLPGRYTLLLADGLPLYGTQAGGFGLLQIPPIDLGRAEIIKGTSSALYGPAALGGVINLISRRPTDEPVAEVLLNQTSRQGTDVALFAARSLGQGGWGGTLLTSANRQGRSDIDGDGWSDMPAYARMVVRPRLFYDHGGTRALFATIGLTMEERSGGTMPGRVAPDGASFAEGLGTGRLDAGASARTLTSRGDIIAVRMSATGQRHRHRIGSVLERDEHRTVFAEATATLPRGPTTFVLGTSYETNSYANDAAPLFDFTQSAPSLFAQADRDITQWLAISANARVDSHTGLGAMFSPRLSVLVRAPTGPLAGWNARIALGTGSLAPTPLTEDTEVSGLAPLRSLGDLAAERVVGLSADVGGLVTLGGDAHLEFNLSAFANSVANPVRAVDDTGVTADGARFMALRSAPLASETFGGELLSRLVAGDARITMSYGYTGATEWDEGTSGVPRRTGTPLIPTHTAGLVAAFEREGFGRAGLEVYYVGSQRLEDNPYRSRSPDYVVVGLLVEKVIGRARWFINTENLLDARQTRYDPLLLPARGRGGRWTTDVWSLLEGRTVNGGVRFPL